MSQAWQGVRAVAAAPRAQGAVAVLVFVIMGAGYVAAVPPWEAPDEPWHMAYAEALAAGSPPDAAETYEAHQPPGYYAALALMLRGLGIDSVPRSPSNPFYPYAAAAHLHPPDEEGAGVVAVLRTVSGFLAAACIALTWAMGRRLLPGATVEPFGAAMLVALLPQYLHIGHSITNDVLAAVSGALLVYVGARIAAKGPTGPLGFAVATAVALAVVAKLTALAAVAAPAAALIMWGRRRPARAARGVAAAALGFGVAAVGLGAVVPDTARALVADATARGTGLRRDILTLPVARALLRDTLLSLWGRFGWLTVDMPRRSAEAAGALAGTGILGAAYRARTLTPSGRRVAASAAAAVAAGWLAWAKNLVADPQAQGRLLFPVVGAGAVLVTWGALAFVPERGRGVAVAVLVAGLMALNGYAAAVVLPEAFGPWEREPIPVTVRIMPVERAIAARVRGVGAKAEQTFSAPGGVGVAAVAVHRAMGGGTLEMRLLDPQGQVVGRRPFEIAALERDSWIEVAVGQTGEPATAAPPSPSSAAGQWRLELEVVRGKGEVRFWGGRDDAYRYGALTVDDTPSTDLVLVALPRGE